MKTGRGLVSCILFILSFDQANEDEDEDEDTREENPPLAPHHVTRMETQQLHPYYELLPSYIAPESIRSERDELVLKAQVRSPFLLSVWRGAVA